MEAIVVPMLWSDWPEPMKPLFQRFRSDKGEAMFLQQNLFVETAIHSIQRDLAMPRKLNGGAHFSTLVKIVARR